MRCSRWIVKAKSRTSFERAISRRIGTALLYRAHYVSILKNYQQQNKGTDVTAPFNIHTSAHIQPSVTSPRRVCHESSRSRDIGFPAVSAVKERRMAAET